VVCCATPVVASVCCSVTVQQASALCQSADCTLWPKRICGVMPASSAVSRMYCRMDGPSAMALAARQGLKS
jgi:hypothetical protein